MAEGLTRLKFAEAAKKPFRGFGGKGRENGGTGLSIRRPAKDKAGTLAVSGQAMPERGQGCGGYGFRTVSESVIGASPALTPPDCSPTGKSGTGETVLRGPGRKVEARRRTECAANHDGGRICPQKRERKEQGSGWSNNNYWTGEVNDNGNNAFIVNDNGNDNPNPVNNDNPVVCLR